MRLKSTRWLSKGRKCVIFEHLAADNAPPLAIVDRMRRRAEPRSSNNDGFPRCCSARNNKEKHAFAAFFERRDWLLNHVVRIGSRHWPLRASAQLNNAFLECLSVMDEESRRKRGHRPMKFHAAYKFRGGRRKSKPNTQTTKRSSAAARRSGSDPDASDEFAAAFEYVSASQKKAGLFEDEGKSQDDESSLIADMTALNMLVRSAMCPTCRHLGLRVREPADKRKGLASFVELHCPNSECPETILSATYTSRRVASGGEASVSAAGDRLTARTYDSGSQLKRAN
ncbi:hypothetical protein HPB50_000925 [Hyalomma asiaticum]|uniref:Uncharacterized protein n=1 Tax=Hyalomma asiaticum TaxID=266040 RepID=A0ACB7TCR4_HYAAI|nr:hypothetical protein HPB50_000925 [Hyalomma asiaticum]